MLIKRWAKKLMWLLRYVKNIAHNIELIQQALGRIELRQLKLLKAEGLQDWEFRVFSQWGEDGILQYLLNKVPIERKIFVEFGVETYHESNTRFLLTNFSWSGLVIDGNEEYINLIKQDPLYWQYNLKAEFQFITKDNINEIIKSNGISGDIGILSIDIDGNDYWVWQAITGISPRIVVVEYNSLLGNKKKISVPYDDTFQRKKAHFSHLYYGASLLAFEDLAEQKGYVLAGVNRAGNNAFFVRKDFNKNINGGKAQDIYRRAQFRESRNEHYQLTFLEFNKAQELIFNMPIVEVDTGKSMTLREAL